MIPVASNTFGSSLSNSLFHSCAEFKWQNMLDLYLHSDSDDTSDGLYQFHVKPFGLCNAPATFQWLMNTFFTGIRAWSTLVTSSFSVETIKEDLTRLGVVLSRLRKAGLKLKTRKCHLLKHSVHYLGHVVSSGGVEKDPVHCRAAYSLGCKGIEALLWLSFILLKVCQGDCNRLYPNKDFHC